MSEQSPDAVPMPVRVTTAIVGLVVGAGMWFPLLRRTPGAIDGMGLIEAFVVMFAGVAVLGILRTPRWPHAPVRAALGLVVVADLLMILSLPAPPRASSIGSLVTGVLAIVLAVAVSLLLVDRPRIARIVVLILAGIGCAYAYGVAVFAMSPTYGATVKESSFLIAVAAMASIGAGWHARYLWRAPTSPVDTFPARFGAGTDG